MTPKITATQAELFDRFARFYDADYRHYQDDLDLILDLADQTGDPILELGCGTGRVLAPLLEAGHTVTGVDISRNTQHEVRSTKPTCAPSTYPPKSSPLPFAPAIRSCT